MLTKIKLETSIFNEIYGGSMFTFDYKESFSKGTYLLIEEMDKCGVMLDRFCIVKVLYSNRSFYYWVRIIINQLKVFIFEIVDIFYFRINLHFWQRIRISAELKFNLIKMVGVDVCITQRVNKLARCKSADLRNHHRKK